MPTSSGYDILKYLTSDDYNCKLLNGLTNGLDTVTFNGAWLFQGILAVGLGGCWNRCTWNVKRPPYIVLIEPTPTLDLDIGKEKLELVFSFLGFRAALRGGGSGLWVGQGFFFFCSHLGLVAFKVLGTKPHLGMFPLILPVPTKGL